MCVLVYPYIVFYLRVGTVEEFYRMTGRELGGCFFFFVDVFRFMGFAYGSTRIRLHHGIVYLFIWHDVSRVSLHKQTKKGVTRDATDPVHKVTAVY